MLNKPIIKSLIGFGILALTFVLSIGFTPQTDEAIGNAFTKDIEKKMVKIQKGLYASKYEVSVIEWKNFIADMRSKNENVAGYDYNQAAWQQFPWTETDPMVLTYFVKSQYKTYPILNITHEGAMKYCTWLSNRYTEAGGKKFKSVQFILPSDEQWVLATETPKGKDLPFKSSKIQDEGGRYYGNVKYEDPETGGTKYDLDGAYTVTNVTNSRFGAGNKKGFVHLFGNVAEMIDIEGQAKGGSWENSLEECGVSKNQLYSGPDPRVGFRVFMTCSE